MCAGEKDRWGGGFVFEDMPFGEEFERIRQIHDRLRNKREKQRRKSEKKEEKGEMGLQLLFGGECTDVTCSCSTSQPGVPQ